MNFKTKITVFVLAGCLLLSSCVYSPYSKGASKSDAPLTINLWHYYVGENKKALEDAIIEFNKTIGIENNMVVIPVAKGSIKELEEEITASAKGVISSDPMPEIFSGYPDKALEIDAMGKLVDLNDYFTEEEKKEYMPEFLLSGVSREGKLLTLPILKSTELLYVNGTAWEAFAAPHSFTREHLKTWEGLMEVARTYYRETDEQTPQIPWDGKAFFGVDVLSNFVVVGMKQLGTDVMDSASEKVKLSAEALWKIFDFYSKGMAMGYFNAIGRFRSDDVKAGDLIAYAGSSSSAVYFPTWIARNNKQESIEMLALNYPHFAEGERLVIQQGAGMCIAKSTPQRQEASALFLKWFTSEEKNTDFAMCSGYLPVKRDFYENKPFQEFLAKTDPENRTGRNIQKVYEITLKQVAEKSTYSSSPFGESYEVRRILDRTLREKVQELKTEVRSLQIKGLKEEEIWSTVDRKEWGASWLRAIKQQLEEAHIDYEFVQ